RVRAASAPPAVAPPAIPFSHETAAPSVSVSGWTLTTQRSELEMTYLDGVGTGGLDVRGSGTLDVVTAPLYAAGRHYRVSGTGGDPKDAVANATGHLAFTVDLGPAHATQQTLFGPAAEQTFTHRRVTIRPS